MFKLNFYCKSRVLFNIVATILFALVVYFLIEGPYGSTSLQYVGVSFLVVVSLLVTRFPYDDNEKRGRYLFRFLDANIIFLTGSLVLKEGYICMIFFAPIYMLVVLIMFAFDSWIRASINKKRNTLSLHLLPLFIVVSSFEGVFPAFEYQRDAEVSVQRIVQGSVEQVRSNLLKPMALQKSRPAILKIFPMPHQVTAGTLNEGDIHKVDLRYYRWFVTNLHEGHILVKLSKVEPNNIETSFVEDTSYLSTYMELKGTQVTFKEMNDNQTQVTLNISYERKLDPYWYFAPLMEYAVTQAAGFIIKEVVARESH